MIKEAIEKILELSAMEEIKNDPCGRKYYKYHHSNKIEALNPSLPKPLELHTLRGIADLIESEGISHEACQVVVLSPQLVRLMGHRDSAWQTRSIYASASAYPAKFMFARSLSIEDFIISVQAHFVDSPEKQQVIDHVSKITGEEVLIAEDDGVSQMVTRKNKTGMLERGKLSPMYDLAPWRTFREIGQPVDRFLLRVHKNEGSLPSVALYEAGFDQWEIQAIEWIYAHLKSILPEDVAVIR